MIPLPSLLEPRLSILFPSFRLPHAPALFQFHSLCWGHHRQDCSSPSVRAYGNGFRDTARLIVPANVSRGNYRKSASLVSFAKPGKRSAYSVHPRSTFWSELRTIFLPSPIDAPFCLLPFPALPPGLVTYRFSPSISTPIGSAETPVLRTFFSPVVSRRFLVSFASNNSR